MGFVARQVTACHHGNGGDNIKHDYRDMVVLYRTNAQSRVVEEALMEHSIPYRMIGGTKFYERKEIKDILSYLRLVYNFANSLALSRIVNVPTRGIGPKTLSAWQAYAIISGQDVIAAGLSLRDSDKVEGLSSTRRVAIADFCEFIAKTHDKMGEMTLAEIIKYIYEESGYKAMLTGGENNIENEARDENIKELLSAAVKYKGVAQVAIDDFLESVALVADTDKIDQDVDAVHLMTLHSVKGLEFSVVFMVGLEEGLLPHARSQLATHELEEERRLMYVGMTRAKEKLYLSHAHHRMIFGSLQSNAPSRFLVDVPENLCERQGGCDSKHSSGGNDIFDEYDSDDSADNYASATSHFAQNNTENQNSSNQNEITQPAAFRDGTSVTHPQFGSGLIVAQNDTAYTVAFATTGIKHIAKSFAGLTSG
jgi:DNA helicase-2/ATP-dependent DNA helicase PcrA